MTKIAPIKKSLVPSLMTLMTLSLLSCGVDQRPERKSRGQHAASDGAASDPNEESSLAFSTIMSHPTRSQVANATPEMMADEICSHYIKRPCINPGELGFYAERFRARESYVTVSLRVMSSRASVDRIYLRYLKRNATDAEYAGWKARFDDSSLTQLKRFEVFDEMDVTVMVLAQTLTAPTLYKGPGQPSGQNPSQASAAAEAVPAPVSAIAVNECRKQVPNLISRILHIQPTSALISAWSDDNCSKNRDVAAYMRSYALSPEGCPKVIGNAYERYLFAAPTPDDLARWSKDNACQIANVGDAIEAYSRGMEGCPVVIRNAYKRFAWFEAADWNVNVWAKSCNGQNNVGLLIARYFAHLKSDGKRFFDSGTNVAVQMILTQ